MTKRRKWFLIQLATVIPTALLMILLVAGYRRDLLKFDIMAAFVCPTIMSYFTTYVFKMFD